MTEQEERPFVCRFVQRLEEFRLPEMASLVRLADSRYRPVYDPEEARLVATLVPEEGTPFARVALEPRPETRAEARAVLGAAAARGVTVKWLVDVWGSGPSVAAAVAAAAARADVCAEAARARTFCVDVDVFGRRLTRAEQLALIAETQALPVWRHAAVDLRAPELRVAVLLHSSVLAGARTGTPRDTVYVGAVVAEGMRRTIERYKLSTRTYLGTTSMNVELALLMANAGLVRPGTLCYDPFVGTGSIAVACAHFGARTLGSDISHSTLHGAQPGRNVRANFAQYGLAPRLWDLLVLDQSRSPLRRVPLFHAIVCDPPYGVRAGARRVAPLPDPRNPAKALARARARGTTGDATTDASSSETSEVSPVVGDDKQQQEQQPEQPKQKQHSFAHTELYAVPDMLRDLLDMAAQTLVLGGRLVFWMPATVEYRADDVPRHPCLTLVSNSLQQITLRWGRRLVTLEKTAEYDPARHAAALLTPAELGQSAPSHADFSSYVFAGSDAAPEHPRRARTEDAAAAGVMTDAAVAASGAGLDDRMLARLEQKRRKKAAEREKKISSIKRMQEQQQQQQQGQQQ